MCISSLLIVSAIGVHKPDTLKKALVYSGLVGFVVYGITNVSLLSSSKKWDYSISTIDTIGGVFTTTLLGYILYKVVEKWPNTFEFV
jgi:uncharacterized membrane protein